MPHFLTGPEVCRAVDIGFGFVKFSKAHTSTDWSLSADAFPSAAPQVGAHDDDAGAGLVKNNYVRIAVDGLFFAIGPDAARAASNYFNTRLDNNFFESPQYLALYRGALHYMNLPSKGREPSVIDYMTVGLPYTVYSDAKLRQSVVSRLTGRHELPPRVGSKDSGPQIVMVKNVRVIPQVLGALVGHTVRDEAALQRAQDMEEISLTVDVGYGTLLWMVSRGLKADGERCGGTSAGVSQFLQTIARSISKVAASEARVLELLDKGLRDPARPAVIDGLPFNMQAHAATLERIANDALGTLFRDIGTTLDIQKVYVTGGGAFLYVPQLQKQFPNITVQTDSDGGRFANVKGYQLLSERRAVEARQAAREAA